MERSGCGAQGQMSHDLAGGLWKSVRIAIWSLEMHEFFGAKNSPLDDKSLEADFPSDSQRA